MSYAQGGLIEATDFNNLISTSPGITPNTLNPVWAVGGGSTGYGQTPVGTVSKDAVVSASAWATFFTDIANSATHQGVSITTLPTPSAGVTIAYLSALNTNLTTIYTNRLSAASQGTTTANTATTTANWSDKATFTHVATFANGDAARYFFNSGGQLAITCAHSNTSTVMNGEFANLAANIGTVVISAMSSGTAKIASTTYNGVTKVGGGGTVTSILPNNGYYALTTANATVFQQNVTGTYYTQSNIGVLVKSNGTQGSNGDAGNVITISTVWDEIFPSGGGFVIGSGSTTTVTVRYPESTNIANTWGTVTITGSATQA